MKTLTFLVFAILGFAADSTTPPSWNALEFWLSHKRTVLDRQTRIQLATHFPKTFGIHFLCRLTNAQGKQSVVFPGDRLDEPEPSRLLCPDSQELTLGKGTKLAVSQADQLPVFHLEAGNVSVDFKEAPFFVETGGLVLGITGAAHRQRMTFNAAGEDRWIGCEFGNVLVDLMETTPESGRQLIASRLCRMDVKLGKGMKQYVLAGDSMEAGNMGVPHHFWPPPPNLGAQPRNSEEIVPIYLSIIAREGVPKIEWVLTGQLKANSRCTMYIQKAEGAAAEELQRFEGKTRLGSHPFDPTLVNSYLSMLCEDDTNVIASNSEYLKQPGAKK
ncbi:MAG TPA: hypothetical protein VIH99_09250 [Bdellovibrionota bacterium]|jgi:hypothetical protein